MAKAVAKEIAFALFDEGKRPIDPDVKALSLKSRSTYNYYQQWKKLHPDQVSDIPSDKSSSSTSAKSSTTIAPPQKATDILANAQELRFVPRVYTTDYSPIIRAAQDAAVEFWGWPRDMTLGDFLDTALHFLFMEHGITLAGYTITDEAQEVLEAERKAREAQKAEETKELQEIVE